MWKTWGRIHIWITNVLIPILIRFWIGIKIKIRIWIRIGIKTMPSHNTGLYASCLYLNGKNTLKEHKFIDSTCIKQFYQTFVLFISQSINQTTKNCVKRLTHICFSFIKSATHTPGITFRFFPFVLKVYLFAPTREGPWYLQDLSTNQLTVCRIRIHWIRTLVFCWIGSSPVSGYGSRPRFIMTKFV